MRSIYCLSLLICLFISSSLYSQVKPRVISVELNDASISTFVSIIEAKTDVHFFYEAAQLDSLRFTLSAAACLVLK